MSTPIPTIDELVWSRLSAYWSENYNSLDREAVSTLYAGLYQVLDAELVRLYQINDCKGIETNPIYTQRRWLRLDLNHYAELRDWLQYVANYNRESGTSLSTGDRTISCKAIDQHAKHWHMNFPWVMPANTAQGDVASRSIPLGYITTPALVEIYRMSDAGPVRLLYNESVGFLLADDGKTIIIQGVPAGVALECHVGFNFSAPEYDGYRPVVRLVDTLDPPNGIIVPDRFGAGYPVHAMVVTSVPNGSSAGFTQTNDADFNTRRRFIPWTDNPATGVFRTNSTRLSLPPSVSLSASDRVFLFAMEPGEYNVNHEHLRISKTITALQNGGSTVSSVLLDVAVLPGLFGSVGFLGNELRLFVNGLYQEPDSYRYDYSTGRVDFATPVNIPSSTPMRFDLCWSFEQRAAVGTVPSHVHQECILLSAHTEPTFETFDDGGTYDDEADSLSPYFDISTFTNIIQLDFNPEPAQLELTANGILQTPGYDYTADVVDGSTRLAFMHDIEGQKVVLSYRSSAMVYGYGLSDIFGSAAAAPSLFSDSAAAAVLEFKATRQSSSLSMAVLLDAASIYAAGGNPMLALFYDEFAEYSGLSVDMPGLTLTAVQARAIESADTTLLSIPFLVDHVVNPTVRLQQGVEYNVTDGEIQATSDLTAKRAADDAAPGVWWCPLVVLDERSLAKNFGFLLGDVRSSSAAYRDALRANLNLRYSGPTPAAMATAACAYLGSPFFSADGVVTFVGKTPIAWAVTAVSDDGTRQLPYTLPAGVVLPAAGDRVYVGQPVSSAAFVKSIDQLVSWTSDQMIVTDDISRIRAGDSVYLHLTDADGNLAWVPRMVTGTSIVPSVLGSQYVLTFAERTDLTPATPFELRSFVPGPPPFFGFDGYVHSIKPVEQEVIQTTSEQIPVPAGFSSSWSAGDNVFRATPVFPGIAEVYDSVSRPGWHWEYPTITGAVTDRKVVITASPGDYSTAVFDPAYPTLLPRSTVEVVQPSDLATLKFTVVGSSGSTVFLNPPAGFAGTFSGSAVITSPIAADAFEFPAPRRNGQLPTSAFAAQVRYGDPVVLLSLPSYFTASGRCRVVLPTAQAVEFDYSGKVGGALLGVTWEADAAALDGDLLFPTGAYVIQVSEYATKRINPAFRSVVQALVTRDRNSFTNQPVLNESNVDTYYDLLRASSAVIETTAVQRPSPLKELLADTMPAGTTAVLLTKHKLRDNGAFNPVDYSTFYGAMTLALSSPDGTITADVLALSTGVTTCSVAAAVVDPSNTGTIVYKWSVQSLTVSSPGLSISDPTISRPRISGMMSGGRYYLTIVAINGRGTQVSQSITIEVT